MGIRNFSPIEMSAELIKALVISKARFANKVNIIATEAGPFFSDVLYIDKKGQLIEIEVKVSKADLINDFKKPKHNFFKQGHDFTPHKFYFCVPEFLVNDALELVKDSNYGVMKCIGWRGTMRASSDKILIIKKASDLHTKEISNDVKLTILQRMSSELANHKLLSILAVHEKGIIKFN